jgi:hypothetical protein
MDKKFNKQLDQVLSHLFEHKNNIIFSYQLGSILKINADIVEKTIAVLENEKYIDVIKFIGKSPTLNININQKGITFISTSSFLQEYKKNKSKRIKENLKLNTDIFKNTIWLGTFLACFIINILYIFDVIHFHIYLPNKQSQELKYHIEQENPNKNMQELNQDKNLLDSISNKHYNQVKK